VLDHQVGQTIPIDQYHLLSNLLGVIDRGIRKIAGRDEHAFMTELPVELPL
jgi:hypothetical protein